MYSPSLLLGSKESPVKNDTGPDQLARILEHVGVRNANKSEYRQVQVFVRPCSWGLGAVILVSFYGENLKPRSMLPARLAS
jgi:hypothetical protein